jgi:hypothetical protein
VTDGTSVARADVFAQRHPASRIATFGESVIREMTRLAQAHGAVDEICARIDHEGEHRSLARLPDMAQRTVVPGSALFLSPGAGRDLVRFAFPRRSETLDLATGRLAAAPGRLGVAPLSVFAQRHASPMP